MPRQPGQKEVRYAHLLMGEPVVELTEITPRAQPAMREVRSENERIGRVEAEVESLKQEITALRQQFDEFRKQFE